MVAGDARVYRLNSPQPPRQSRQWSRERLRSGKIDGWSWLEVPAVKAMKGDTFLRECPPGYYDNEGKNQRDSIWLGNYGGGPFE